MGPYSLFTAIALISLCYAEIPAEKDFVSIEPYAMNYFNIKGETRPKSSEKSQDIGTVATFSFINKYEDGDVIINFAKGLSYQTFIYVYESYASIKQGPKGEYIDYLYEGNVIQKEMIIEKAKTPKLSKGTLYIIIIDKAKFNYKDFISIFNEQEPINFNLGTSFIVDHFYSKAKRLLSFNVQANTIANLYINTNSNKVKITVVDGTPVDSHWRFEKKQTDMKYQVIIDRYSLLLENSQGESVMITSNEDVRECLELKENISQEKTLKNVDKDNEYYFYVPVEGMALNEERSLTAYFDYQIIKEKQLSKFNAKVVNLDSVSDDPSLKSHFPKDATEFNYQQYGKMDTMYQMFFYKSIEADGNKKPYLLIYIAIKGKTNEILKYSLGLSPRIKAIDLTKNSLSSTKVDLENNIPSYYSMKIDEAQPPTINYLIYASRNILTVYYDSLFTSKQPSSNVINTSKLVQEQFYSLLTSKAGTDRPKTLVLQLFSSKQTATLTIETTKEEITQKELSSTSTVENFSKEMNTCSKPSYIIFSRVKANGNNLYYTTSYGKFTVLLKQFDPNNDYSKNLLPDLSNEITLDSPSNIKVNEYYAILGIQCKSPGLINIKRIKLEIPTMIDKAELSTFILKVDPLNPSKTSSTVRIAAGSYDTDFNINISSPSPKGLTIKIDKMTDLIDLDKEKGSWNGKVPKDVSMMTFNYGKEKDYEGFMTVALDGSTIYEKVDDQKETIDNTKENLMIKLEKMKECSEMTIELSQLDKKGFKYDIIKATEKTVVPKLTETNYPINYPSDDLTYKLNIPNPYLKYQVSSDGDYYVVLSFLSSSSSISNKIKFTSKAKITGLSIKPKTMNKIGSNAESSNTFLENDTSLTKKLVIITGYQCKSKSSSINIKTLELKHQSQLLETIKLPEVNTIKKYTFDNYGIESYLSIKDKGNENDSKMSLSYDYVDSNKENEYAGYEQILSTQINYDETSSIISWEQPSKMTIKYKVYIVNKENKTEDYCDVKTTTETQLSEKPIVIKEENNKRSFMYTHKNDNAEYYMNIIAVVESPMNVEILMKGIEFKTVEVTTLLWLWIVLGILGIIILAALIFFIYKYMTVPKEVPVEPISYLEIPSYKEETGEN